jgi:hypothetical protein
MSPSPCPLPARETRAEGFRPTLDRGSGRLTTSCNHRAVFIISSPGVERRRRGSEIRSYLVISSHMEGRDESPPPCSLRQSAFQLATKPSRAKSLTQSLRIVAARRGYLSMRVGEQKSTSPGGKGSLLRAWFERSLVREYVNDACSAELAIHARTPAARTLFAEVCPVLLAIKGRLPLGVAAARGHHRHGDCPSDAAACV